MLDMGPVVEPRQIADEANASDRPPADVLDQAVVGLSCRCNHHGAAGVLAVVESQEQARAAVDQRLSVSVERKWAAAEPSQANKDRGLISHLPPTAESAHAQCSHIGGETDTENVDVVEHSVLVAQAEDI